jgi:signal peptidase I
VANRELASPRIGRGWGGIAGRRLAGRRLAGLAVTALLVVLIRVFVLGSYYIPSASMEPTLHGCPGCQPDRVLVDKLAYRIGHLGRGDVVVFSKPASLRSNEQDLVKRVIGLPGDTVSASGGTVYVDGKALTEHYVSATCHGTADFGPETVPVGDAFVMGDNRCDSLDSRVFGPIRQSAIVGRAFARVWPVSRWSWL